MDLLRNALVAPLLAFPGSIVTLSNPGCLSADRTIEQVLERFTTVVRYMSKVRRIPSARPTFAG
jgi:hypothetical protein